MRYISTLFSAFFIVCTVSTIEKCTAEMFTAMVGMEAILHAESALARDLNLYIINERHRLEKLKSYINDLEAHSAQTVADVEEMLGNPVIAFQMIKKFTTDWTATEDLIKNTFTPDLTRTMEMRASWLPTEDDLNGAALAIFRLQDTYKLTTAAIASASVREFAGAPPLSAVDCFSLGLVAYSKEDSYHALLWFKQAYDLMADDNTISHTSRSLITDYYAYLLYKQGNLKHALNMTNEWLTLEPNQERALKNKAYYEATIADNADNGVVDPIDDNPALFNNYQQLDGWRGSATFKTYESLCRGEDVVRNPDAHKLTCQYMRHHPMYFLGPLKMETVHLEPWIAVYHEVLTNADITHIKQLAIPKLHRSGVFKPDGGKGLATDYRISKSAWLDESEHPALARMTLKTTTLNNLTSDSCEQFQVLNYGLGGHYEPHFDYAKGDELKGFAPGAGNRISTVICYLTDVTAGGATVFPGLGVKLWPQKGSCAVWFNMRRNGELDDRTQHAACPVLAGQKWVCNKWYHEQGQEFVRKCSTNPYE